MTRRLSIRSAVYADLEQARRWYDNKRAGLGDAFLDCIFAALKRLPQRSLDHTVIHVDVRRYPIERFPYGIFYRIIDEEIVVIAVLHGRQSLRRLRKRD